MNLGRQTWKHKIPGRSFKDLELRIADSEFKRLKKQRPHRRDAEIAEEKTYYLSGDGDK